jgi:NADP-dependent 3-hydroxy acid dehydrogenase YdfG
MSENIEGKIVVITGASSGLGHAAARHLAAAGAKLVLGARRGERLAALAAEIGLPAAAAVPTDVTERAQVTRLVETAISLHGRIDVLLNNAGVMPQAPLARLRVDEWERMIDVNIKGVLYGVAAALPHMIRQKSGQIINVASVAAHKVRPNTSVYSATKAAVRMFTEGLRQEVKPYGIRTTLVSPGAVASELPDGISEADIATSVREFYARCAIPAESFARVVAFAISQPEDVDINEVLFRPTAQEY